MTMPFCPHCGGPVDQLPAMAAAEAVSADVEIARIQAERDIEVAKIAARGERDWNETHIAVAEIEAAAEVGSAEAEAEVIGEILSAETGEPETEDQAPIVVTAPPPEDDGVDGEDLAPPEVAPAPREPKPKGWGF